MIGGTYITVRVFFFFIGSGLSLSSGSSLILFQTLEVLGLDFLFLEVWQYAMIITTI